ncbi:hypothetical protein R1sor_008527 [Riccia sorocarpa]|uniref:DUF7912 domain-containing protein n=1 Tax=Riccia sorocarpa TaxID=122646 RepID=A0ABD3HVD2_9MARC
MQGSLILPRRFPHQSAAVVHSTKVLSPELVGALRFYPSRTYQSWGLEQVVDRQSFRSRRAESLQVLHSLKKSCARYRQGGSKLLTVEDKKSGRMRGGSLGSFPSCSYSRSVSPLVPHATVANGGQILDSGSWKRLSSAVSRPFHCNQAKPWLTVPFRAFPALKTTHYGSLACRETRQDVLTQRSEKGSAAALGRAELAGNTQGEKTTDGEFIAALEDSDSDSDEEDDEKDIKKKEKKEMKVKGMQDEEDSDSDSDSEEMEQKKKKKKIPKVKVEVVGTYEDDSDSESESDEEKAMKKKIKAQEKELKKQAKKQKKAMSKMDGEYSESEDEEKKMKKEKKEQKKAIATLPDEDLDQYQYIEVSESDGSSESDLQEDDGVEIVASALEEDDVEEDDFELVGDEELSEDIESDIENAFEEFDDEELDEDFWEEEGEAMVGDGGDGGGVALGETRWGKKAFELAEVTVKEMGTDFTIYAFKTSPDGQIRVRLDKMSEQYGSPTMKEIEDFIVKYRAILDSCEVIPDNISVEVSSPGAERMVKIPGELERFKQLPMYVQYYEDESRKVEKDGVLELDSLDSGSGMTVWKLANVKLNRELSGKGRPLNSKQRKWRAQVPADSLKLVRLYLDV